MDNADQNINGQTQNANPFTGVERVALNTVNNAQQIIDKNLDLISKELDAVLLKEDSLAHWHKDELECLIRALPDSCFYSLNLKKQWAKLTREEKACEASERVKPDKEDGRSVMLFTDQERSALDAVHEAQKIIDEQTKLIGGALDSVLLKGDSFDHWSKDELDSWVAELPYGCYYAVHLKRQLRRLENESDSLGLS